MMKKKNARLTEAKPSAQDQAHFTIRARIHAAIVWLALWGVLPVKVAVWLIRKEGGNHA